MARAYMEARLTRLYTMLTTQNKTPFGVINWVKYKRLFRFQKFVQERFNRLDQGHSNLMERYYGFGETVTGAENVALVEVRKAFRAQLSADEIAALRKWSNE